MLQISIIIPTFHRNDLLARCLDCLAPSVQTLSAEAYEVIVTDDGYQSTAEQMIRDHYPWVRWLAGPRQGPAANRNHGARQAQAEWLVFTDDDCLPAPNWLAEFVAAIVPEVQVYEGKTICEAGRCSPLEEAPVNPSGGWLWSCNMMVRRQLFVDLGGFDQSFPYAFMEDTEFRERLRKRGIPFQFVATAVVDHPPRKVSLSARTGAQWESLVYYWRRKEGRSTFKVDLYKNILIPRVRAIFAYPFSWETLQAMLALLQELTHVTWNLNQWDDKYPVLNLAETDEATNQLSDWSTTLKP
jgi:GT2 family glycosyltransferase